MNVTIPYSEDFVCPQAIAIMEVVHGKDHHYLTQLRKEMAQK